VDYLMGHAAPCLAGVLAKIEVTAANADTDAATVREWLASAAVDLMRLAQIDSSPTFDPFIWMCDFERRGGSTGLIEKDGRRLTTLSLPLEESLPLANARDALNSLASHERAALDEYLREILRPADFGLVEKPQAAAASDDAAPAPVDGWSAALARWEAATAAEQAYFAETYQPLWVQDEERRMAVETNHTAEGAEAHKAWSETSGWNAVNDRIEELQGEVDDARKALLQQPAPNGAALLWKLDRLFEKDEGEGDTASMAAWHLGFVEQTMADFRRILGGEA